MTKQKGSELVKAFKKEGSYALLALHTLYYSPLCEFAAHLLNDLHAAEDIVAEVFVVLWKKRRDFSALSNIRAFLYISTRNACINHLKKMERDAVMKTGLSNYLAQDYGEFILNEMVRAEVIQQIHIAIEALPIQCRRIIKMCYVEGLNNHEIAEMVKISVNTVKNHKVRALSLLRLKFLHPVSAALLPLFVQLWLL